jgi:hypothetical protein
MKMSLQPYPHRCFIAFAAPIVVLPIFLSAVGILIIPAESSLSWYARHVRMNGSRLTTTI